MAALRAVDALNRPMPLGADILSEALNLLAADMADDGRALLFLERIKEAAVAVADNLSESVYASSKSASETAVDEEVNFVEVHVPKSFRHCFCDRRSCLADINVLSFEELHLLLTQFKAARDGALPFHVSLPGGVWRKRFMVLLEGLRVCSRCSLLPGRASQNYLLHFLRSSQT